MVVSLRKNKKQVVEEKKRGGDGGASCPAPYLFFYSLIYMYTCIYFNCHQVHIEKVL